MSTSPSRSGFVGDPRGAVEGAVELLREGKGDKDRVTTMPRAAIRPLQEHLQRVEAIHQQDVADGYGRVELPQE